MTKGWKLAVAIFVIAVATVLAPNVSAQSILFNGVGSSAAFQAMALAARVSNGGTPPTGACGNHNWTSKGPHGVDGRSGFGGGPVIPDATGKIWVVWDDSTGSITNVCAYMSVDSIVGVRLFFAQLSSGHAGSLNLNLTCSATNAGAGLLVLLPADENLPQSVCTLLTGATFTAAISDIRPEDAQFQSTRTLTGPYNNNGNALGYGPSPVGTTVQSAFSSPPAGAQPVAFNVVGTDPITGASIPAFVSDNVGAQALLAIVNTTGKNSDSTTTGHFSDPAFNNVDHFVMCGYFDGTFTRTRDLIPGSGNTLKDIPVTALYREPTSGTYTTFEFDTVRDSTCVSFQEKNLNSTTNTPAKGWMGTINPILNVNCTGAPKPLVQCTVGARRMRVIGTGEMVAHVGAATFPDGTNGNNDTFGYAFWSFGNYNAVARTSPPTAKYLAVDGVDPLFAAYSPNNGALPFCTDPTNSTTCPTLTFPNIKNGSYRLWNTLRVVSASGLPAALKTALASSAGVVSDFVPISQLQVFRSHFPQGGVTVAHNGNGCPGRPVPTEAGGDVGGGVFTVQADNDDFCDTGKELLSKKQ